MKGVPMVDQLKLNEAATTRLAPASWFYPLVPLRSKERMISKFIRLVTSRHQMSGSPEDLAGSKYGVGFEQRNGWQQGDLLPSMFPTRPQQWLDMSRLNRCPVRYVCHVLNKTLGLKDVTRTRLKVTQAFEACSNTIRFRLETVSMMSIKQNFVSLRGFSACNSRTIDWPFAFCANLP